MTGSASRIERLRGAFGENELHALLVTDLTNVRYLTGFSGTNGQLFVSPDRKVFLSDPRYEARAADLVEDADIEIYPNRLTEALAPLLEAAKVRRLGIEAGSMTLAERDDLVGRLTGIELVSTKRLVEDLRRRKDAEEVRRLREAVALGDQVFAWVLERLAPGMEERRIALDLEIKMREMGAEGVSFPPIVGSGPLSAHIHHTAGERELQKGDLVLLDLGCRLNGYCSDLTRTVVLGPASEQHREIYDVVLRAQLDGIAAVGQGVRAQAVDARARGIIETAGYGDRFAHGLGHGVGLDVHEDPRLRRVSEDTLSSGDVVTVEPGIYLDGVGGVRIEDCVLVTETGREVLGAAPKHQLMEL